LRLLRPLCHARGRFPDAPHHPLACDKVPDFSPDGRRIAFARDGTGTVYLIDTDGTDLTPLYAPAYYPAFSPNGRRIAFYRSQPDGASDIYTVRTDGSNVKRLTFSESGVRAIEPSWGVRP
jgi:Tol biopolymer transport system component